MPAEPLPHAPRVEIAAFVWGRNYNAGPHKAIDRARLGGVNRRMPQVGPGKPGKPVRSKLTSPSQRGNGFFRPAIGGSVSQMTGAAGTLPVRIAVFGLGYVGTTNAACLGKLGHSIIGVDVNEAKTSALAKGRSPIVEPHVPELLAAAHAAGLIHATVSPSEALRDADLAMVCVGTPSKFDGATETQFLNRVIEEIATERRRLGRAIPVFVRSTSLPTVHRDLIALIDRIVGPAQPAAYCVHPEFLREGEAVADFFGPPKIVYGPTDAVAAAVIPDLYPGIVAPQETLDPAAAALVKYADNCFHAVKVTFGNEIGLLASSFGIDARKVMRVFCLDTKLNISARYLTPGLPFGGSCLPKDLRAVNAWSRDRGIELPLLDNVMRSNRLQVDAIIQRIVKHGPASVALLGLAFKDDTDDLRQSPMLLIFEELRRRGIEVKVFDPLVSRDMVAAISNRAELADIQFRLTDDVSSLVAECELAVIARRKLGIDFRTLPWPEDAAVFDLVGVEAPLNAQRVFGLYW